MENPVLFFEIKNQFILLKFYTFINLYIKTETKKFIIKIINSNTFL